MGRIRSVVQIGSAPFMQKMYLMAFNLTVMFAMTLAHSYYTGDEDTLMLEWSGLITSVLGLISSRLHLRAIE